jgi:hypothetical protein
MSTCYKVSFSISPNFFLRREGEANHVRLERQEKWSQLSKILWAKSIDENSILILPLYYGKKTFSRTR